MEKMIQKFLLMIICIQCARSLEVHITDHWQSGLYGYIRLHPHHALHGWKVKLKFTSPVQHLEMYQGKVVSHNHNRTEFVVTNKNYNMDINKNQFYSVTFTARGTHGTPKVSIENMLEVGHHTTEQTTHMTTTMLQASTTTEPLSTVQVLTSQQCVDDVKVNCSDVSVCSDPKLRWKCQLSCSLCNACVDDHVFNCTQSVCNFPSLLKYCPSTCGLCVPCGDSKVFACNPSVCSIPSLKTFCPATCNMCATSNLTTRKPTVSSSTSTTIKTTSSTITPLVTSPTTAMIGNESTTQNSSSTTNSLVTSATTMTFGNQSSTQNISSTTNILVTSPSTMMLGNQSLSQNVSSTTNSLVTSGATMMLGNESTTQNISSTTTPIDTTPLTTRWFKIEGK